MSKGLWLSILAVVLALAVYLVDQTGSDRSDIKTPEFFSSVQGAARLDMKVGDSKVSLKKGEEGLWTVTSGEKTPFPADGTKLSRFFDTLAKAKIIRTVGKLESLKGEIGFADRRQFTVGFDGGSEQSWNIGAITRSAQGGGSYVFQGEEEDSRVFLLDSTVTAESDADRWYLKEVLHIESKDVQKVLLTSEKGTTEISRAKPEENLVLKDPQDGKEVDQSQVDAMGRLLEHLNTTTHVAIDAEPVKQAMKSHKTAEIHTFAKGVLAVKVGAHDTDGEKKWFATFSVQSLPEEKGAARLQTLRSLEKNWAFEIPSYIGERFHKSKSDFYKAKKS